MTTQDRKTLIIHGKNPIIRPPESLHNDANTTKFGAAKNKNSVNINAASIERKIDDGKLTTPPSLPMDIAQKFVTARLAGGYDKREKLAQACSVPVSVIGEIETGKILLNTQNRQLVRKIQTKLKMEAFTLP
jgi:ribosome-binding protein aMBF1 (putative translation factor)